MLVNKQTGQQATAAELEASQARAHEILASAYSPPEQVAWAMDIPGVDVWAVWESSREKAQKRAACPDCGFIHPAEESCDFYIWWYGDMKETQREL